MANVFLQHKQLLTSHICCTTKFHRTCNWTGNYWGQYSIMKFEYSLRTIPIFVKFRLIVPKMPKINKFWL